LFSKQTRCLSLDFTVPQRDTQDSCQNLNTKRNLKGKKKKKDIYTDSGGRNIFLKVILGCSKILRAISAVVASLMNKWRGLSGLSCEGTRGGKKVNTATGMGTRGLWHRQVLSHMQKALLRGTRVSKTRPILEWPTVKIVGEEAI